MCLQLMTIVLGVGIDSAGVMDVYYKGQDFEAAKTAIHDAGQAGTILEGFVYRNPPPSLVMRFGPGMTLAAADASAGS